MARLLQGDVGSGKTLVAWQSMLIAAEAGRQAALLVPTELLARQHHATLSHWGRSIGLEVGLLTGSLGVKERGSVLTRLAEGRTALIVGTHALIQPDVAFRDLALAIVDEQHRFGVEQRLALLDKRAGAHLLLMSATPIPRSLLLAVYGDLSCSSLREKPPGRQAVDTRVISAGRLGEVVEACARALARGARIYWICPRVEADPNDGPTPLVAAEDRAAALTRRFGNRVGLAHGRQPSATRQAALDAFAQGQTRLLVATTVVEVGVDVPEANVIVIEGAERFGLAQLHQLRGRVGRNDAAATCLLVYGEPLSAAARHRLQQLRESDDGFALAETDLALRGPGEVLGVRQSGTLSFRFADLARDRALADVARAEAERTVARDPSLSSDRGSALRWLLRLFGKDRALGLLDAG